MPSSYRRRCKYCGAWISMRQMPHGQWVAFDANGPHDCRGKYARSKTRSTARPARSSSSNAPSRPREKPKSEGKTPYHDVEFPEISVAEPSVRSPLAGESKREPSRRAPKRVPPPVSDSPLAQPPSRPPKSVGAGPESSTATPEHRTAGHAATTNDGANFPWGLLFIVAATIGFIWLVLAGY